MGSLKPAVINRIKGVFFDYGGVLEDVTYKDSSFNKGVQIIKEILDQNLNLNLDTTALSNNLKKGLENYGEWYKNNNFSELPNSKIWTEFLLDGILSGEKEKETISKISEKLSSVFEFYLYARRPSRGVKEVLKSIFNMGYTIALISNTMSETLIPERLQKLEIKRYFSSIVLSVSAGIRKPRPEIFYMALNETGLKPQECIYVGDTLSRDVEGSKRADFAISVLIKSSLTEVKDKDYRGTYKPDYKIKSLNEIIELI